MNSEIRIISPKTKIIITLGIGMTVAMIISMFMFPLAWQMMLYTIAGGMVIYFIGSGYVWIAGIHHRLSMMKSERNQSRYMTIPHTNNILDAHTGQVIVRAVSLGSKDSNVIEGNYQEVRVNKSALSLIDDGYHFLMIGDTGSGKSTLAGHFINRIGTANTIVCDPHATFNEWPKGVKVAQDYEAIATILYKTVSLMKKRYETGDKGNLVLLAIDELPSIIDTLAEMKIDAGQWIRHLSREGRKVNIRLLIMSQGENVGDLGQKGYSSVKLNFIKVLMNKADTLQNIATAVYSNGNRETISLHGSLHFEPENRVLSLPAPKIDIGLSQSQIDLINNMRANGESMRSISQAVWGNGKIGSYYNQQIESVLNG